MSPEQLEAAAADAQAVRRLHRPNGFEIDWFRTGEVFCGKCGDPWPCRPRLDAERTVESGGSWPREDEPVLSRPPSLPRTLIIVGAVTTLATVAAFLTPMANWLSCLLLPLAVGLLLVLARKLGAL